VAALLTPGGKLDIVRQSNPEAHLGFQKIGTPLSVLLMFVVGTACAWAAVGLARQKEWGRRLVIGILAVNLIGDCVSALARHDPRLDRFTDRRSDDRLSLEGWGGQSFW